MENSKHISEFNKNFEQVEPKKIVTFLDLYRKGQLYAFDLRDGSDFQLNDSHEADLLKMMSSPDYFFGTEKEKVDERKGNVYFLFGERACEFFDSEGVDKFVEEYDDEGYELWEHDHSQFSVIDFANAMNGYGDFSILSKEEFDKISNI